MTLHTVPTNKIDDVVRPIIHATESSDDVDRLLKENGLGELIFSRFKTEWPQSRYALEYPEIDFILADCRLEVHVARRRDEEDRVSVGIRFPERFSLSASLYPVDFDRRTVAGSDQGVLGDGHIQTLRYIAQIALSQNI
jgi:hypothetical protein